MKNSLKKLRVLFSVLIFTLVILNFENKAYASSMDVLDYSEDEEIESVDNTLSGNALDVVKVAEENGGEIFLTEAERNALRGYWDGHYFASQGKTALRLKIVSVASDGKVQGFFHFTEHVDNPGVPYGCYTMEGTYNAATGKLDMKGIEWLVRPSGYVFATVQGDVNTIEKTIEGNTNSYKGLYLSKSLDLLEDTDIDSSMSKYYEEFGQQGYGSLDDTIKIEKNGKKYRVTPVKDSKWNIITVAVGNKFQINSMFDKKSFKTSNKNLVKVSSKGLVTARKSGKATISFTVNGTRQIVQVVVVQPKIMSDDKSAIIRGLKATAKVDTDVNVSAQLPINAVVTKITNKNVISNFKVEMDNKGHFSMKGHANKKGTVKVFYNINGKKCTVQIKITK